MTPPATMQRATTMQPAERGEEESGSVKVAMRRNGVHKHRRQ
jgi:hypothetical protein